MSIRPTNSKDALKDEDSDQPQSDDESRLSRWSRRKRDLSRQRSDSIADAEDNAERSLSSDTLEDASTQLPLGGADDGSGDLKNADTEDKPLLTDADMPDIETLTPDSDFKPFMSKGVSHALRRKALRKLFASPFFQIRDGLDDYDDDFTSFAPLGDTVTADMKYAEERKEMLRREAEEAEAEAERQRDSEQLASNDEPNQDNSEQASTDEPSEQTQQIDQEATVLSHDEPDVDRHAHPASSAVSSANSVRGGGMDEYDDDEEV